MRSLRTLATLLLLLVVASAAVAEGITGTATNGVRESPLPERPSHWSIRWAAWPRLQR